MQDYILGEDVGVEVGWQGAFKEMRQGLEEAGNVLYGEMSEACALGVGAERCIAKRVG